MTKIPTLKACEEALGEKAETWVARCYEISCRIVKAGLVKGTAVYGHWLGPVHRKSHFAKRNKALPFIQHGWILLEDGTVLDATRWVFEARKPYLYEGVEPDDFSVDRCENCEMLEEEHVVLHDNGSCGAFKKPRWPYDEGGNKWREAMQVRPAPKPKAKDQRLTLKLSTDVAAFVSALIGQVDGTNVTKDQIFWLANLPYQKLASKLGPGAVGEIYEAICAAGDAVGESYFIEFIPIDNRTKAKHEAGFARK